MTVPHLLVIDDEPEIGNMIAAALDDYRVTTVHSTFAGQEVLEIDPPDVLILDIMLPGHNGLKFLHEIRPDYPDLPVIILTAYASVERAVEALRGGAHDFLMKPSRLPEIKAALERVLTLDTSLPHVSLYNNGQRIEQATAALSTLSHVARDLTYNISDPLTIAALNAELIARSEALDEQNTRRMALLQKSLERIEQQVHNLRALIFGDEEVRLVSLESIVESSLIDLRTAELLAGCQVAITVEPDLPLINTKAMRLRRTIDSILTDAANLENCTGKGSLFKVAVQSSENALEMQVNLPHVHLSADEVKQIIEPEFDDDVAQPTCLGLYLARTLAEANDCTLEIQNISRRGLRITLQVPVETTDTEEDEMGEDV